MKKILNKLCLADMINIISKNIILRWRDECVKDCKQGNLACGVGG